MQRFSAIFSLFCDPSADKSMWQGMDNSDLANEHL